MKAQREVQLKLYSFFTFSASWERKVNTTPPLIAGIFRYPLTERLDGTQSYSGRVRKISPPPVVDRRTVQSIASRYTDRAMPASIL